MAPADRQVLESWKEISAHLKHGVRTCQRWEFELGLPIHRLDGTPKARVFAYTDELDRWIEEKLGHAEAELNGAETKAKVGRKKLIAPALGILGIAIIALVIWRIFASNRTTSQPTLAVVYFENKSGDPGLDNWRDALAELVVTDLSQSRYIRVISGDEMYTILKRLGLADARKYSSEDIQKIAGQARATFVLRGSYIRAGESYVIMANLEKPGAGERLTALRLEARDEKDIIAKVDELTRQVKEGLDLTAVQISGDIEKEAGKITTSSPEALRYYIEGRKHQARAENEQAIAYMEKAVEIDPGFAMAYRNLAAAHGNLGHVAEARKYYKKALDLSDRLPENERLVIEGQSFAYDENYAKAIETFKRLVKTYPGHYMGRGSLALVYALGGDIDKAIEQNEIAVQIRRTALAVGNLACWYMLKGLYQKAENVCRSFLQDVEDGVYVRFRLACSYVCRRQFDLALAEAEKLYLLAGDWKDYKGRVLFCEDNFAGADKILVDYKWQTALRLARGKLNEMIGLSQLNLEKSKGDKGKEADAYGGLEWDHGGGGLVWVLVKNGFYGKAYQAFVLGQKLRAEYNAESGLPYLPGQQKSDLFTKGTIQAEMKSFDEARKTAEELKSMIENGINTKELKWYESILGLIELGKKDYNQAADLFGRACGRLDFENGWESDQASFFDNLARALYQSGDLDKARKTFEKITLLTSGRFMDGDLYAKAFYMLGKIAEQQGDKARAGQNYRKFLDLWKDADPGLSEVADAKRRLAGLKGS